MNFIEAYQKLERMYVHAQDEENKFAARNDFGNMKYWQGVQEGLRKARRLFKEELEKDHPIKGNGKAKSG